MVEVTIHRSVFPPFARFRRRRRAFTRASFAEVKAEDTRSVVFWRRHDVPFNPREKMGFSRIGGNRPQRPFSGEAALHDDGECVDAQIGETEVLDYKSEDEADDDWEKAKDMAAFANHLGGVLLVGAFETRGAPNRTAHLKGIGFESLKKIRLGYENAAKDKCSPPLTISTDAISRADGTFLLAVNVEPRTDQLVGARSSVIDGGGNRISSSDAWRFYVRIGTHNTALTPDRLTMFMDPKIRRAIIALEGIPCDAKTEIYWRNPSNNKATAPVKTLLASIAVAVEQNVLIATLSSEAGGFTSRIPLDDVQSVWALTDGPPEIWAILVRGGFDLNNKSYYSNPDNAVHSTV
jgi:hypothetical protein